MRSNSKVVKGAVKAYVMDRIDLEGYEDGMSVMGIFRDEFCNDYNMKRWPNECERFGEWLMGLPSVLSVECDYEEVRRILIEDFGTNTPRVRDDAKSYRYFLYLIYVCVRDMEEEGEKELRRVVSRIERGFK